MAHTFFLFLRATLFLPPPAFSSCPGLYLGARASHTAPVSTTTASYSALRSHSPSLPLPLFTFAGPVSLVTILVLLTIESGLTMHPSSLSLSQAMETESRLRAASCRVCHRRGSSSEASRSVVCPFVMGLHSSQRCPGTGSRTCGFSFSERPDTKLQVS